MYVFVDRDDAFFLLYANTADGDRDAFDRDDAFFLLYANTADGDREDTTYAKSTYLVLYVCRDRT